MKILRYILIVTLLLIGNRTVFSQAYTFTNTTGTYIPITSSLSMTGTALWDDEMYRIPIGFNFKFYDTYYDSISVESNGVIYFDDNTFFHIYVGFLADLIDRGTTTSLSKIHYKVSGTFPNRTLTIEFKNCGFYSDPTSNSYVNFQIVLTEGSHKIETKMGTSNVTNPTDCYDGETGPLIGLFAADAANTYYYAVALDGKPTNPTLEWMPDDTLFFLNGTPQNNRIYRFNHSPVFADIQDSPESKIDVFPNPSNGIIHFQFEKKSPDRYLEIYSVTGQLLQKNQLQETFLKLETDLPAGCYILKIFDEGIIIKDEKLIISH